METIEVKVKMTSVKKGYNANGVFDGKGITVLAGSIICKSSSKSDKSRMGTDRSLFLDAEGKTIRDFYFKSPSAASDFVCGRSSNGWVEWVTQTGVKLAAFRKNSDGPVPRPLPAQSTNPVYGSTSNNDQSYQIDAAKSDHSGIPSATQSINQQPSAAVEPPRADPPSVSLAASNKKADDSSRLENKLDFLLGAIANMYPQNSPKADPLQSKPESVDKRFRLEPTSGVAPVLMLRKPTPIIGLIFAIKLIAVGPEDSTEQYRLFFTNKEYERISTSQTIDVIGGEEYTCRFELASSASEEDAVYLVVQGVNSAENEATGASAQRLWIEHGGHQSSELSGLLFKGNRMDFECIRS